MPRRLASLLLAAAGTLLTAPPSAAEPSPCDPELETRSSDELGYRLRGERCEGRYAQEDVASTTLTLAGFLATAEIATDKTWKVEALKVGWAARPAVGSVHLRAQGLRSRLYYRMDAVAAAPPFVWPTDVLAALDIPPREIGLIAWTRRTLGGEAREVYLPLTVRPAVSGNGGCRLVILPGRELSEVYLSLAPLGKDGVPGEFLKDGEALGYGFYPAGRGTRIELPALPAAGFYHLEIGATLAGGGVASLELVFYHPG